MIMRKIQGDSLLFFDGEQLVLTVDETDTDDGVLISMKGALKRELTHHIQDELDAFITVGVPIRIDLKEATYVSASLLYALISCQQLIDFLRKGKLVLKNIPAAVYQAMDESGISERLLIER